MVGGVVSTLEFGKPAGGAEANTCLETRAMGRMVGRRSAQAETIQPELEQQPVQPPIPPSTSVPVSPPTEPILEFVPIEQTEPSQRRPRKKLKAGRFPQKLQKEPTSKRRRTEPTQQSTKPSPIPESVCPTPTESVPVIATTEPHVKPNDTSKVQAGQSSVTTVREATAFPEIHPTAHELAAILQFGTSYELVEWLAKRVQ